MLSVTLQARIRFVEWLMSSELQTTQKDAVRFWIHIRGAGKSVAQPASWCILFDGENISFDASLVTYINSINIPPIMIINRIYENQNLLSL